MNFRKISNSILCAATLAVGAAMFSGCHRSKAVNPIANVDSKQPDKVLFDRAMAALKSGKYEVTRSLLQTMINTYPDSEFVARAKLSIADSWYDEGNTAAFAQAEREYKDFQTFFPNMPEAAEAQMKIANIHYDEMGKPDRDYTQAKRAEDEYRQMIQQYPDHKLVPQAKQRLRDCQEVLAEGQFRVASFYYGRESWPAAIARFKTLADTYPLYSQADQSLFLLGRSYENEMKLMENSKMRLQAKKRQRLITDFRKNAIETYTRLIERYPAGEFADASGKRLQSLEATVPTPTPEAIAQNKQEIASRNESGIRDRAMLYFSHRPDTSMSAKVGEPTMEDPQEASAPAIAKHASDILTGQGDGKVNAEIVDSKSGTGAAAVNPLKPVADASATAKTQTQPATAPAFESVPVDPTANASSSNTTTVSDDASAKSATAAGAGSGATTAPATPATTGTPAPAGDPPQSQAPAATSDGSTNDASQPAQTQTPAQSDSATQPATQSSDNASKNDSSSAKTKKKKHKLNPF
jgi:outer membrane protein assembly factor BamD